jgi:DNA-binding response OmpR family regulator
MISDELKEKYLRSLVDRIDELAALTSDFQQGDLQAQARLRAVAHSLHGSGATFGYPQLSKIASSAEHASIDDLQPMIAELVNTLKQITVNEPLSATSLDILIIDDDPEFAEWLKSGFTHQDKQYRIFHAATAIEAQQYFVKRKFALIILDLVLPDRDGRDLLLEIKQEYKLSTPVFIVSSIDQEMVRAECKAMGALEFITKPVDVNGLVTKVDKQLKKTVEREFRLVPMGSEIAAAPVDKKNIRSKTTASAKAIMVAEDDAMQAELIKQRLEKEGFVVDLMNNGQAALNNLNTKPYSLYILDVNMPKVDGFTVLQKIRTDQFVRSTPVIMLTAVGSEEDILRGYDLGANDYILKPYSAIQLVARVKSLLKKSK